MAEKETGARAKLQEVQSSADTMPLSQFLKTVERKYKLSRRARLRIVQQALLLLEMNYVHLPLKRAMHAIDPIQRLRLLRFRLMESREGALQDGMQFHKRMLEIFASTRDLHTIYLLPAPFRDQVAFLPFLTEQFFENKGQVEKFLISRVVDEFLQRAPNSGREADLFEPGVEVLYWNGVPIRRAIEINGEAQAGSNLEARFARGLDNLTIRPLDTSMPPDEFVEEFRKVIKSPDFPQEGLIIDVRGNGGGKIRAGERLLQLFTPHRIKPELFEFINTPLNLDICRLAPKQWNLARWADSIAESVVTGATYSSGFPLNSEESCNDIGQVYCGPVVLITDALSYSTTDIFAAGFQDNSVGEVLGTSDNTGAGGANMWYYEDLIDAVRAAPNSPFKPLPQGADLLVAVRRSIRVGRQAGRPLEELGITPDVRHHMTKRDLLKANDDLIRKAARILEKKPIYSLSVKPSRWKNGFRELLVRAGSKIQSGAKVQNIARLDVCVAGRPYKTFDSEDGSIRARRLTLKHRRGKNDLLVQAFDRANNLLAAYRHD